MTSVAEVFKRAFNTSGLDTKFQLCNGLFTCHKDEEYVAYEYRGRDSDFPLLEFLDSNGISPRTHQFEPSSSNSDVAVPASPPASRVSFPIHTTDKETLALRLDYLVRKMTFMYQGTDFTAYIATCDRDVTHHFYFFAFKSKADQPGEDKQPDVNPGKALLEAICKYAMDLHEEVWSYRDGAWEKDKELYRKVQAARWENLILKKNVGETLRADVNGFFQSRCLYEDEWVVPWARGILLSGRGNGKTQSIFALLKGTQRPALYVKSLAERPPSSGRETAIKRIFSHARAHAPCVLVLEDLEEMIKDGAQADFLQELDENRPGVFIIATTNHPERIAEANLIRPTRFDTCREYLYEPPQLEQRIELLQPKIEKLITGDVEGIPEDLLACLVKETEGASFAHLEHLLRCLRLCIARTLSVHRRLVVSESWLVRNLCRWNSDAHDDDVKSRRTVPSSEIFSDGAADLGGTSNSKEDKALIQVAAPLPIRPFIDKIGPAQEDVKLVPVAGWKQRK